MLVLLILVRQLCLTSGKLIGTSLKPMCERIIIGIILSTSQRVWETIIIIIVSHTLCDQSESPAAVTEWTLYSSVSPSEMKTVCY